MGCCIRTWTVILLGLVCGGCDAFGPRAGGVDPATQPFEDGPFAPQSTSPSTGPRDVNNDIMIPSPVCGPETCDEQIGGDDEWMDDVSDAGPMGCSDGACTDRIFGLACCTESGTGWEGHRLQNAGRGAGLCGSDLGAILPELAGTCFQLNQPGRPDGQCPDFDTGFGIEVGCCTEEGYCGHVNTSVPLGCAYLREGRGESCEGGSDADAGVGG